MFNAPSASAAALPQNDYIQPNLNHALRIWWAYYWPTFLISTFIIFVGMVSLQIAWQDAKISGNFVLWGNRILPFVATYGVSILTIRYIFGKRFRHFRIALLPLNSACGTEPLPRSFRRSMRLWWAFCWRAVVYSIIVRVAASVVLGYTIAVLSEMGHLMAVLIPLVSQIAIDGAVGLFVIYSAILDEDFGDFRVCLMPRKPAEPVASAVTPTAPSPLPQ